MSEVDQVQSLIHVLRKPEARTLFSEILLSSARQYFAEVLNQQSPPELIKKFNEQHGILLFSGSTLRGTARPETSDLDVIILYDGYGSQRLEQAGGHVLDKIVSAQDYHPDRLSFSAWFARKLKADPELRQYYESRRNARIENYRRTWREDWKEQLRAKWERINKEEFEKKSDEEIVEHEIEQSFIFCEAEPVDIDKIVRATRKISEIPQDRFDINNGNQSIKDDDSDSYLILDHFLYDAEIVIPELLTATNQFAIARDRQALLQHQQRVVRALDHLQQTNPNVFEKLFERLAASFHKRNVVYEGGSHGSGAAYYRQLEKDYIVGSGRFPPEKLGRAARLLRGIKAQTKFPSLEALKQHYLVEPVENNLTNPRASLLEMSGKSSMPTDESLSAELLKRSGGHFEGDPEAVVRFEPFYKQIATLAREITLAYREIALKYGDDPGDVQLVLGGGRAKGKRFRPDSDLDLFFQLEHPEKGLDRIPINKYPQDAASADEERRLKLVALRDKITEICRRHDLPNLFHVMGYSGEIKEIDNNTQLLLVKISQ